MTTTDPTIRAQARTQTRTDAHTKARRRDRRVYLHAHPLLFALLAATRGRPVRRLGRGTLLVHGAEAYREALTRLPLDRTAPGTTGGAARAARVEGVLFDQEGSGHRTARRELAEPLGAAGTRELRSVWHPLLLRRLAPLALGGTVDLVPLARELAGSVVYALLRPGSGADASPSPSRRPPPRQRPPPCAATSPARPAPAPSPRRSAPPGGCAGSWVPGRTTGRRCWRSPPSTPRSRRCPGPWPGAPTRACGTRRRTRPCAPPWPTNCCA